MTLTTIDNDVEKNNRRLGGQIRDLRKSKGVTQTQLAQATGRSIGYISQLERGLSSVSIPVLKKISDELGVNISWFFHTDDALSDQENNFVVRKDNRRQLSFSDGEIKEELLSKKMNGAFIMILTTLAPGAKTDDQSRERVGDESGYIRQGQAEFYIEGEPLTLLEGDTFSVGKDDQFQIANVTDEPLEIIWVLPSSY
ncbi:MULTISPECIES: helix-turn-helix transcriptional regulator [unclassified Vibrio]|uniref:Helix-turn-helix domain-containing protein n=1 Tax=Vibrio sp. HB236076 TaxID=3232307 RepID=A0AB39HKL3_9VIBR|nr:helix-turn-helix transcriptional regulator [Vibrio sp. HB161653]MDP5253097.1 helix-turn-helix domain-containing protein [Vibrio sp. HB161653]